MKGLVVTLLILMTFSMAPVVLGAQADQTGAGNPPVAQPLVREGTLAVKLAEVLGLGTTTDEAAAESMLISAGVAPRNGWIADYPVTPDIVGELRTGISDAADAGRLTMAKGDALKAFQDVAYEYNLPVMAGSTGQTEGYIQSTENDPTVINDYYYDEGPPVVTYYTPPPDYAYLYTWVPYPFWWWDYWFSGFFVLVDFDVHNHHGHFSNHFFDREKNHFASVDPARRAHGGTFTGNVRPRTFGGSVVQGGSAVSGGHRGTLTDNVRPRTFGGSVVQSGSPASFSGGHSGTVTGGNGQVAPSGGRWITSPTHRSGGSVVTPVQRGGAVSQPAGRPMIRGSAPAPVRSYGSYGSVTGARSFTPSVGARSSAPSSGISSFTAPSGGGRMSSPAMQGSFGSFGGRFGGGFSGRMR